MQSSKVATEIGLDGGKNPNLRYPSSGAAKAFLD